MEGVRADLLAFTPDPVRTVAAAARLCYSPRGVGELLDRLEGEEAAALVGKLLELGHLSAFEHASFTFGVEGISRAASHQLVRHRLASYSQQSQRYVRMREVEAVIPPAIEANPEHAAVFREKLEDLWHFYSKLVDAGVAPEDARYILPNACATKLVVTMNARELRHFFSLRMCNRAQWEIRALAEAMFASAARAAPELFEGAGPGCVSGKCPEGAMTCGKSRSVKKKVASLLAR